MKDLPPSVQKTVQDNLKGGAIKTIGKEKEDGIEQYEIETTINGKARDFNVAVDGRLQGRARNRVWLRIWRAKSIATVGISSTLPG